MAAISYHDFDLLLETVEGGYRARVLNSPAGQATATFSRPFSDLEFENFILRIGRQRRLTRRIDSPELEFAKKFGGQLFSRVFADDIRVCLQRSIDIAGQQQMGLRVRLRLVETPELAHLPWEYLYNESLRRFLALSVETPIVRYLDLPELVRPLGVEGPLRILVAISGPSDYPRLDTEQEWTKLHDSLGELEGRGSITIGALKGVTLSALQTRLRRSEYHIFHFIGHGGFDPRAEGGVLLFEDERGRGRPISGTDLGILLHDHRTVRLAVLNACEGARASTSDPFAGVAQSLVQQRVPAVIAMQFEITDEAAITFAREFYAALSDDYPVDAALGEARKTIWVTGNELEWATPVLYMRAPDGRIFVDPTNTRRRDQRPGVEATQEPVERSVASSGVLQEPSRQSPQRLRGSWYLLLLVAALLTNVSYGLTSRVLIDLTVLPPILTILAAWKFGKGAAAVLGTVSAGGWLILQFALGSDSFGALVYKDFAIGPLLSPHSSIFDLLRLSLLGFASGWLFQHLNRIAAERGISVRETIWQLRTSITRPVTLAYLIVTYGSIVLANLVTRPPRNPSSSYWAPLPASSFAVIVCLLVASRFGPRQGVEAGLVAALVSFLVASFVLPDILDLEFHQIGHLVSFGLIGYVGGYLGLAQRQPTILSNLADRLSLIPRTSSPAHVPVWLFIPFLFLLSLRLTIESPGSSYLFFYLLPCLTATVILMGVYCGAEIASWTTAIVLSVVMLVAPIAQYFGYQLFFSSGGTHVAVNLARTSAVSVVTLTTAAWLSGKVELVTNRRNLYWLAIGIFSTFELSSILRFGFFLPPYIGGRLGPLRLDLLGSALRLVEPWLIVLLVRAGTNTIRKTR